jgi:hypothetical protein
MADMEEIGRVKKNQKKDPNPSQSHQCRSDSGIKPRQLSSFPNLSFWMLHLPNFKGHTKPTTARARAQFQQDGRGANMERSKALPVSASKVMMEVIKL